MRGPAGPNGCRLRLRKYFGARASARERTPSAGVCLTKIAKKLAHIGPACLSSSRFRFWSRSSACLARLMGLCSDSFCSPERRSRPRSWCARSKHGARGRSAYGTRIGERLRRGRAELHAAPSGFGVIDRFDVDRRKSENPDDCRRVRVLLDAVIAPARTPDESISRRGSRPLFNPHAPHKTKHCPSLT